MSAPPARLWADLRTTDFGPGAADWVAVLPIAAVEQHGPHLPLGTDATIGAGLIEHTIALLPPASPAVFLPLMAVGGSAEHGAFAGTLSLNWETMARALIETGTGVAAAGVRRFVIISSHGGNRAVMDVAARELRLRHKLLVVPASWQRFGLPAGLVADEEAERGMHGGDVETSLMLHLAPASVAMDKARDFPSRDDTPVLPHGQLGFSWAARDIGDGHGVVGNAAAATAEKGAAIAEHSARGLADLIDRAARFEVDTLK
jgi:creatinine amidohydrolase